MFRLLITACICDLFVVAGPTLGAWRSLNLNEADFTSNWHRMFCLSLLTHSLWISTLINGKVADRFQQLKLRGLNGGDQDIWTFFFFCIILQVKLFKDNSRSLIPFFTKNALLNLSSPTCIFTLLQMVQKPWDTLVFVFFTSFFYPQTLYFFPSI